MNKQDLITKLFDNIVTVEFTKVNGDFRKMKCTLQKDFLPEALSKEPEDFVRDDKKEKTSKHSRSHHHPQHVCGY